MKTSLIMAIYNGEKYLEEQLNSIRDQTKKLNEVLLIDDCSTDNSFILIKQYIIDNNLSDWQLVCNANNLGYRKNFQKGLSIVTGDVVFLCDQDDRWHLDKIEMMIKYLKDDCVLSLASSFNFMNQNGEIFDVKLENGKANNNLLLKEVNNVLTNIPLNSLIRSNFSQGCTMAVKRELVNSYLKIDTDSMPHDWALNMIASIYQGCYYLDIPLIDYRIHDNNTIGLDEIIESDKSIEKNRRINERIDCTYLEKDIVSFALTLPLNNEQHILCKKRFEYLEKRIGYMFNKKLMSLVKFFVFGGYRGNGELKTFLGDAINIIKVKKGDKND